MKLKEKRAEWEKGCEAILVVPVITSGGYKKAFVIIKNRNNSRANNFIEMYQLHRYIPTNGDNWDVSVDVPFTSTLSNCIARIFSDKDVMDMYGELEKGD